MRTSAQVCASWVSLGREGAAGPWESLSTDTFITALVDECAMNCVAQFNEAKRTLTLKVTKAVIVPFASTVVSRWDLWRTGSDLSFSSFFLIAVIGAAVSGMICFTFVFAHVLFLLL